MSVMRLGVDFGTSRTVVVAVVGGNTPIITFSDPAGDAHEFVPTLVAASASELCYGWEAAAKLTRPGWTVLRSLKRLLADNPPQAPIALGDHPPVPLVDLVSGFLRALKRSLRTNSNCPLRRGEKLRAMISVPANAGSNQRYITLEAFRRAGFELLGLYNEPSAAGIEYAHRYLQNLGPRSAKEWVVVYDLGGGTFDTSVVGVGRRRHDVVRSEGIGRLGGEDFDRALLDLVVQGAGAAVKLDTRQTVRLLEECRERKEGLSPNTRRVLVDVDAGGVSSVRVETDALYARCRPLIERTLDAVDRAMEAIPGERADDGRLETLKSLAAVYLVGGSSQFPAVARAVRERFPRRVKRAPYPHAATAIGLAVAAQSIEEGDQHEVSEAVTRHFGVWREGESGHRVRFDPIFAKDARLTSDEAEIRSVRRYQPVHNVGHLRFVECTQLTASGDPAGDLIPWEEIHFPYDPDLRGRNALAQVPVRRVGDRLNPIEEVYTYDRFGVIEVEMRDRASGYSRTYRLSR